MAAGHSSVGRRRRGAHVQKTGPVTEGLKVNLTPFLQLSDVVHVTE